MSNRIRGIISKDLRCFARLAVQQGCLLRMRGSGHYELRTPDGKSVFFTGTPVDRRGVLNVRAEMRRAGIRV